ncbi:aminotransferase class V-fold PLP-dependent enzyme [Rummeliibacillus pycnus]|uniref:aminotransferase class V-fold PLP-dependent enzyme n=1 Tax=Rummeliibacillus pycnus TaxID=101070 RepID=UPI003D2A990C
MYWCKIARTEKEYDEIAKLNYETFVEEIAQHQPNEQKRLIDRFHSENTYLLVYKDIEMVGMLAFRDQRPFSLDEKIGKVELFLEKDACEKLCEIRLLAVKKEYRNGRVFSQLAKAIYSYVYDRGYSAAVISGIKREKRLYNQIGFQQFAEEVGTEDAKFLPMILTRRNGSTMSERIRFKQHTFFPGPVEQEQPLTHTGTSHRSTAFFSLYNEMNSQLLELSNAKYVTTFVGTGTLANDVMLGQMKAEFKDSKGLVISNGEFGERLIRQAKNWQLNFDICSFKWGESFNLMEIEQSLWTGNYHWICFVHGETSTGICNDFEPMLELAKKYNVKVCADCISSFGSFSFSMEQLHLATALSGKSIGALSGLAFVFSNEIPQKNDAPLYINLAHYYNHPLPSTMPAYLVANLLFALQEYPKRFELLHARMEQVLKSSFSTFRIAQTSTYPMIISMKLPLEFEYFSDDAKLNGLLLHDESIYLKKHQLTQISVISLDFEAAFEKLKALYVNYLEVISLGQLKVQS